MNRKSVVVLVLCVLSVAVAPVLAQPHHIIISQTEYHANPGDTVVIPFELFFSKIEQAKLELYGDRVAGWGCKLDVPQSTFTRVGEGMECSIVVPVPASASNGTYGLILQDIDAFGEVTSRVSIFIVVGTGGNEVQQEMHYYEGWIANENMPRTIQLPVHNFVLTVGVRKLAEVTMKLVIGIYYPDGSLSGSLTVDPAGEGNYTYTVGASGWHTGGTYSLKIWVYNVTDPENPILLDSMNIPITVLCPGSENAILLDSFVINAEKGGKEELPEEIETEETEEGATEVVKPRSDFVIPTRSFFMPALFPWRIVKAMPI